MLYTGYMDEESIILGLKNIKEEETITEVIIHPYRKSDYEITKSPTIRERIQETGFKLIKYKDIC